MAVLSKRFEITGRQAHPSHVPVRLRRIDRPVAITAIAMFQFAKAWFLLLVVMVLRYAPEAMQHFPALPQAIYFAAHGRDTHGYLLPVIGVYVAVTGWGLWRLQRWARRSLIASSGLMLAIWAHRFYLDWSQGETTLTSPLAQHTVTLVLFLDAVVLLYLVCYDDVRLAFAESEARVS